MSLYSGKCDLWDSFAINEDTNWEKVKIYQITSKSSFDKDGWHDIDLLNIKSLKDLLPYAGFVPSMMSYNSEDGYVFYIFEKPHIDSLEEDVIKSKLDTYKRVYRKYKKEGKEFIPEEVVNSVCFIDDKTLDIELAERVKKHPTTKDISGLRYPVYETLYRKYLISDMIKEGYTEEQANLWVYENKKTW